MTRKQQQINSKQQSIDDSNNDQSDSTATATTIPASPAKNPKPITIAPHPSQLQNLHQQQETTKDPTKSSATPNSSNHSSFRFDLKSDNALLRHIHLARPFAAPHGKTMKAWADVGEALNAQEFEGRKCVDGYSVKRRFDTLMDSYKMSELDGLRSVGTQEEANERLRLVAILHTELSAHIADKKRKSYINNNNAPTSEKKESKKRLSSSASDLSIMTPTGPGVMEEVVAAAAAAAVTAAVMDDEEEVPAGFSGATSTTPGGVDGNATSSSTGNNGSGSGGRSSGTVGFLEDLLTSITSSVASSNAAAAAAAKNSATSGKRAWDDTTLECDGQQKQQQKTKSKKAKSSSVVSGGGGGLVAAAPSSSSLSSSTSSSSTTSSAHEHAGSSSIEKVECGCSSMITELIASVRHLEKYLVERESVFQAERDQAKRTAELQNQALALLAQRVMAIPPSTK